MSDALALTPAGSTPGLFILFAPDGRIEALYRGTAAEAALQAARGWRILGPVAGPADPAADLALDPAVQYVDPETATLRERPACPAEIDRTKIAADGAEVVTLSGLPVPATVIVARDGLNRARVIAVPDGELVWDTDLPGTYTFTVQGWPWRDGLFTVTAR